MMKNGSRVKVVNLHNNNIDIRWNLSIFWGKPNFKLDSRWRISQNNWRSLFLFSCIFFSSSNSSVLRLLRFCFTFIPFWRPDPPPGKCFRSSASFGFANIVWRSVRWRFQSELEMPHSNWHLHLKNALHMVNFALWVLLLFSLLVLQHIRTVGIVFQWFPLLWHFIYHFWFRIFFRLTSI